MTREEWKARLPLIQTFVEGKTIQFKYSGMDNKWKDINDPVFNLTDCEYRIKPEPKVVFVNEYYGRMDVFNNEERARQNAESNPVRIAVKYVEVVE